MKKQCLSLLSALVLTAICVCPFTGNAEETASSVQYDLSGIWNAVDGSRSAWFTPGGTDGYFHDTAFDTDMTFIYEVSEEVVTVQFTLLESVSTAVLAWTDANTVTFHWDSGIEEQFVRKSVEGDVSLDGVCNAADAVLLQKYLLGTATLTYAQRSAADLDGNGETDVFDLGYLKRALTTKPEPPESIQLDVMLYNQHPAYPTGCESVALYMLLKYYNTDVTVEQIVEALPKGPLPYMQNGVLVGPNPEREFVGDPRNSSSYGVFNEPIAKTAMQFRSGVQTRRGATVADMLEIVDSGNPVVAWYTTNPSKGIVYRRQWQDYQTGETVRWPGGEHAVVVCGHDKENLTYRDPNTGGSVTMAQAEFSKIFDELGGRIVYYEE